MYQYREALTWLVRLDYMGSNSAPIPPVLGLPWVSDDIYLSITQQAWLVDGESALLHIA